MYWQSKIAYISFRNGFSDRCWKYVHECWRKRQRNPYGVSHLCPTPNGRRWPMTSIPSVIRPDWPQIPWCIHANSKPSDRAMSRCQRWLAILHHSKSRHRPTGSVECVSSTNLTCSTSNEYHRRIACCRFSPGRSRCPGPISGCWRDSRYPKRSKRRKKKRYARTIQMKNE